MPILNLFSRRQKESREEVLDVYQYSKMSAKLRNQIIFLMKRLFEFDSRYSPNKYYLLRIVEELRMEYGVRRLSVARNEYAEFEDSYFYEDHELFDFIFNENDIAKVFDAVEMLLLAVNTFRNEVEYDLIINEINHRFRDDGFGYQYEGGEFVRIDSHLVHAQVVKPALVLLSSPEYSGAQQEFLKAHEHYRTGNHKESLNECLKAFESTMKVICQKRGWVITARATCKDLIQVCYDNELFPQFWQQHFSGLRASLEGGIPTGRNRLSGHGQGSVPTDVPEQLVAYMLHMTASTIVFLVESEKKLT